MVGNNNFLFKAVLFLATLVLGALVVALLQLFSPDWAKTTLLGQGTGPISQAVHYCMWLALFMGIGVILIRVFSIWEEAEQYTKRRYLPTDGRMLDASTLDSIHESLVNRRYGRETFLPQLLTRVIEQYRLSRNQGEATSVLNASLELHMHEIDLRYSSLRYLTWLIPSLGFIGTVLGIMFALQYAGNPVNAESDAFLYEVTSRLGVAFTTTLVALVFAAVLVFLQSIVQATEERGLNRAGQYTIDNLILRLGGGQA
jgi:biopolymer transport protein ExbB/TolQ